MLWGLCVTGAALVGQKGQVYRIDDRSRYSFHALLLPIGFLFRIHWPVLLIALSDWPHWLVRRLCK